jgi:hypothetical protein
MRHRARPDLESTIYIFCLIAGWLGVHDTCL